MTNPPPDISYIVTGYNVASSVRASVESALMQEQVRHEVVYIDDGSEDASAGVVEQIVDSRLRVVRSPHIGRSAALNLGIQVAHADSLAILDADDTAAPERSRLQLDYLRSNPGCQAVSGQVLVVDARGRVDRSGRMRFPTDPDVIDAWLRRGRMSLSHPSVMFRRQWFDTTGGYDPAVLRAEDFDLFLRGWQPGLYAALPHILTTYRADLFPSWAYWQRENQYTRAVHRRWVSNDFQLGTLELAPRPTDTAVDALKWGGQLARHFVSRRRQWVAGRRVNSADPPVALDNDASG